MIWVVIFLVLQLIQTVYLVKQVKVYTKFTKEFKPVEQQPPLTSFSIVKKHDAEGNEKFEFTV